MPKAKKAAKKNNLINGKKNSLAKRQSINKSVSQSKKNKIIFKEIMKQREQLRKNTADVAGFWPANDPFSRKSLSFQGRKDVRAVSPEKRRFVSSFNPTNINLGAVKLRLEQLKRGASPSRPEEVPSEKISTNKRSQKKSGKVRISKLGKPSETPLIASKNPFQDILPKDIFPKNLFASSIDHGIKDQKSKVKETRTKAESPRRKLPFRLLKAGKAESKQAEVRLKKKELKDLEISKIKKGIIREIEKPKSTKGRGPNLSSIKESIRRKLKYLKGEDKIKAASREKGNFVFTGIEGFDALLEDGIPKGSSVILAGGAGSGKTIFALQVLYFHALHGEKCLYMSFEESENKLIQHMEQFGWNPRKLIKEKKLVIQRFNPFDVTRSVDALLMEAKGELLIDVKPIIFPDNFNPDFVVIDSLTAIASAFTGKEDSYRIYIEQLFLLFEKVGATSFQITETEQVPKVFSPTGVEEFLADGVVVFYNIQRGNIRERALEILKLRGAGHQKKIVAMSIGEDGIKVFPEQEVFGGVEEQ